MSYPLNIQSQQHADEYAKSPMRIRQVNVNIMVALMKAQQLHDILQGANVEMLEVVQSEKTRRPLPDNGARVEVLRHQLDLY